MRARAYGQPVGVRGAVQVLVTAGAFAVLWLGMWLSLGLGYWITLLLSVPTALFLVRLFVIQHDCGHGSFFRSRRANDLLGRAIGVLTLTPYGYWRRAHAIHHATSGNLDRRGVGDVTTLTVREYRSLSDWRRLAYRLYRHPLVMFGIGPIYLFVVKHRMPLDLPLQQRRLWLGVLATNVAIVALTVAMAALAGTVELLKIQLPVTLIAASAGVWLFFVQHQFEDTYWRRAGEWDFHSAAVQSSSYYDLPKILQWFTASIGLHHVHHLCSRVPNYRLQECLDGIPELAQVKRLTVSRSLGCARMALWDEAGGKLVGFRALQRARAGRP